MSGGLLIREARLRAGLSEEELAQGLGVSPDEVERWESRAESPTMETITRAVRACGLDLHVSLVPYDDHDLTLALQNLRLTPEQRVWRHQSVQRFTVRARQARPVNVDE